MSKIKPNLLQQSIRSRSLMNSYVQEASIGQNSYLPNYYCSNYSILGLSFGAINSFLPYPFCEESQNCPSDLEPQWPLFYMQNENFSTEENSFFPESAKAKFKLNPEAKEYIPIALLSKANKNLQPDINCAINQPQMETSNKFFSSDYGFIRDNCEDNFISTSKQISTDLCGKKSINFCDSETSEVTVPKDKITPQLDLTSKHSTLEELSYNLTVSDKPHSPVEIIEMPEEILIENLTPKYQESMKMNNLDSVSDGDSTMQQPAVLETADNNASSDESDDETENEYDSDSSDEEEDVSSEQSDYSDENDECFEGLKSDESFIKFGSLDSIDSNNGDDCKTAKEINGSDSVNAKSSIFSLICNPDSDSEGCNAEDSDYDYDIFSVQLDDGWDLSSGGLQISAFISHCSPDICAKDSSNSDLSVVDGLNKACSDCTNLCGDETCSSIGGGGELEVGTNIVAVNEKWKKEIDKNLSLRTHTKVSFNDDVEICSSIDWDRHGPWEQYARDRMRFARRIEEAEPTLSKVLSPEHRQNIYQKLTKI